MVAIADYAYSIGARHCIPSIIAPEITALHLNAHAANGDARNEIPSVIADQWNMLVEPRGCTVRIEAAENPLAMSGCNQAHVGEYLSASKNARNEFYEKGLFGQTLPWTIVPRATSGWAEMIFHGEENAREKLQEVLDAILEVDHPDCVERWQRRSDAMNLRSDKLNALQAESFHFTGDGTDLTVGISPLAHYSAASMELDGGIVHIANIPTFEHYTTPDWRTVRGHVRMTRPVLLGGVLVEGLSVWFNDNGEVERFEAEEGGDAFQALIDAPGGNRLGELALVGIDDSAIFQSGVVFRNTLLDENAACHIAFGQAYPSQIKGGTAMSNEEKEEIGCNLSDKHHDMMISDETTRVTAKTRNGQEVAVIEQGKWASGFKA